jgi:hypothetical protein
MWTLAFGHHEAPHADARLRADALGRDERCSPRVGGGVGETLAISIPRTEVAVVRHFQERMPYGLFVPDVDAGAI